ncbi:MAG: hypothetical protein M1813_007084 [Trichoglossum hirsutum]|nr:MAG: hypothetical protein M1813_007084 [Trichoglossum hirsutum]
MDKLPPNIQRRDRQRGRPIQPLKKPEFTWTENPLFRLCGACAQVDFTKFAWRNELRRTEAFPGVSSLPRIGCGRMDNAIFVSARPKLGSIDDYGDSIGLIDFHPCSAQITTVNDTIQCLTSTGHPRMNFSGRRLDPSKVDLRLLKFWLSHCESHHGKQCYFRPWTAHLPWAKDLFLIDVEDMCIVPASNQCRYVALSYVWGQCNNYKFTKADFSTVQKRGMLREKVLPATIEDAITVTQAIGFRYLWIDAFVCQRAVVTLIAAAGDDANAGLAGVRSRPHELHQDVVFVPGVTLMSVLPIADGCSDPGKLEDTPYSTWYSRAWTMQEQLFSSRKLIFAENQVYWSCDQANWVEETVLEFGKTIGYKGYVFGRNSHDGSDHDLTIAYPDDTSRSYYPLAGLAGQYLCRNLTHESDRLNAFTGILGAMSSSQGERYLWGLPESSFSGALFWDIPGQPRTIALHRRVSESGDIESIPIPSWSWLAWRSAKGIHRRLRFDTSPDLVKTEVDIYQLDSKGARIKIEQKSPDKPHHTHAYLWKIASTPLDTGTRVQFNERLDTGLLQFWASTASVYVRQDHLRYAAYHLLSSEYSEGPEIPVEFHMGSTEHLQRDDPVVLENVPHLVEKVRKIGRPICDKDVLMLDFVIIARDNGSWYSSIRDGSSALRALVVEWKNGIAYRLGFAIFSEENWISLENRQWRLVTLG